MSLSYAEKTKLRTWVELDRSAIKKNYYLFRKIVKRPTRLMGVVKSNAYGHGLSLFGKEIAKLGIDFLGVDSFEEGLELRQNGIKKPIMVFGYVAPAYFKEASKQDISVSISSMTCLFALAKSGLKLKVHIKADTGLGRQGFLAGEKENVQKILLKNKNIILEGVYSHLALGEERSGKEYIEYQVKEFIKWCEMFRKAGFKPIRHICATSSTFFYPEYHFDMVRIGIGLYGLWPSSDTKKAMGKKYRLYPVLSWKGIITEIKFLLKGVKIGYDLTEQLKRNSTLAVVPVGYWHGYPRLLSGKGIFNVNGKKVKLIGRVSMDYDSFRHNKCFGKSRR